MESSYPTKFSSARRKGDEYEKVLFASIALDLLWDSELEWIRHEARELAPVDDVVAARSGRLDCYQAKHAKSAHGLFDLEDLEDDPHDLRLTADRLREGWEAAKATGRDVIRVHLYTNRAAGPELAKILEGDRIAPDVISGDSQKRRRQRLLDAAEVSEENEEDFLQSLRFDLRQPGLEDLRHLVAEEKLVQKLGLDDAAYAPFMVEVNRWFEAHRSEPVTHEDVLEALPVDTATLPQSFPIDEETYVHRGGTLENLAEWAEDLGDGYGAVVGPPGIGKSTIISRYVERLEDENRPVLRYFAFTSLTDPESNRRVSADEFIKSLIEQLYWRFGNALPDEGRYEYSQSRFQHLLFELAEVCREEGERLFVIVDGMDHVERTTTDTPLTKALPSSLPEGVTFIFGTQGKRYLPDSIRLACEGDRTWNVPTFQDEESRRYLNQHPALSGKLSEEQITRAVDRSEGLPLYLRYIAERLSQALADSIDDALDSLPAYTGDIDDYYRAVWAELEGQPDMKRAVGLLARLRFRIRPFDLAETLNLDSFEVEDLLKHVRHLLTITEAGCRIFHASFRQFVESTLTEAQRRSLDGLILDYLKERKGSAAWYAHAFDYARMTGESDYVLSEARASFVEDALVAGRPFPEISDSLQTAFDVAAEQENPVELARIAELLTQTTVRLEDKIDRRQLLRTLFALGDSGSALAAVATQDSGVYGDIEKVARALVDLARFGHYEAGQSLSESYFDRFEGKTDRVPTMMADALVVTLYSDEPSEWVFQTAYQLRTHEGISARDIPSGVLLLRRALDLLEEVGRDSVIEALDDLIHDNQEASNLYVDWIGERALRKARRKKPEEAETVLREAADELGDDAPSILFAGEAALSGCDADTIQDLLGSATLHPSLENEEARPLKSGEKLRRFRSYAAALSGLDDSGEIETLRKYLREGEEWAAVYYQVNVDLMEAVVRARRGDLESPEELLQILDRLIDHEKGEGERIYEVFQVIREDLSNFLDLLIKTYLDVDGPEESLIERLRRWHESELVSLHYGIYTADGDYSEEVSALHAAAREPRLHDSLRPLLVDAHDRIWEDVRRTRDRSRQFLEIAEVAARASQNDLARDWLKEGLRASRGYGGRKDVTLFNVVAGARIANRVDPDHAVERLGELASLSRWMSEITDQKDPKWVQHRVFDAVLDFDPSVAANFLQSYRKAFASWKFSDCTAKLLKRWDGERPRLAYVLSEAIDECTWEYGDGFRDKSKARVSILQSALADEKSREGEWIAERLHRFLLTEVPPDLRSELSESYNSIAEAHGFPTTDSDTCDDDESATDKSTTPEEDTISWPEGLTLEVEGEELSQEEVLDKSKTVDGFTSVLKAAESTWREADPQVRADLRNYVQHLGMELLNEETSMEGVSRITEVLDEAGLQLDHSELADRYLQLGDHDAHRETLKQAFINSRKIQAYSRDIDILEPLFDASPTEGVHVVMETVIKDMEEYGTCLGAATLMMKALERAGRHEDTTEVYANLRDYTASMFESLPDLPGDLFSWTRERPLPLDNFEEIALELIWDVWGNPQIHRRMNITHLSHDLAISEPDTVLHRLVESAVENDVEVQAQSALVLDAISRRRPDLLSAHAETLSEFPTGNLVTDYHLEKAAQAAGEDTSEFRSGSSAHRINLHGVAPSKEWVDEIQPRLVPYSVKDRILDAGRAVGWDRNETFHRVEEEVRSSGLDVERLRDVADSEHKANWSRVDETVVPYLSFAARKVLHSTSRLFGQKALEDRFDSRETEEVVSLLRRYDPALPWKDRSGIPNRLASYDAQTVESWSASPVPSFERVPIGEDWTVAFENYYLRREGFFMQGSRTPCLVPKGIVESLDVSSVPNPGHYLLDLSPRNEATLTIAEAQEIVRRYPREFSLDSVRAFIGLHTNKWWYWEQNILPLVAPDLVRILELGFSSSQSLDLVDGGGRDMIRHSTWRDGVKAKSGKYQPAGKGVSLTVNPGLLRMLRDDFGVYLLVKERKEGNVDEKSQGQQMSFQCFV